MKKEIAVLWVKALRSGEYSQIQKRLKSENGFCCLGVLCDISGQGKWDSEENPRYGCGASQLMAGLPKKVCLWSGVKDSYPGEGVLKIGLSVLNDTGSSFSEIADIIDLHWESL